MLHTCEKFHFEKQSPWWWWQYAPLKRRSVSIRLRSATSEKTAIFILAAQAWRHEAVQSPWRKTLRPIQSDQRSMCRRKTQTFYLMNAHTISRSRGSSGSIVSDYGLDVRAIGVRSPAGAKDFSCNPCVQTDSGAHPASCTMGTGDPFPGG
jgi:hypothetical protein